MKKLKNITLVYVVFIALLLISSCSNDDDFIEEQYSSSFNSNGAENESNNENSNFGSGNQEAGTNGEITLYKVNGSSIVKIKDYQVGSQLVTFQQDVVKHQEILVQIKKLGPCMTVLN